MSSDKIPLVTASCTTIARTEENQIPEGCVFLYPGMINIDLREKRILIKQV